MLHITVIEMLTGLQISGHKTHFRALGFVNSCALCMPGGLEKLLHKQLSHGQGDVISTQLVDAGRSVAGRKGRWAHTLIHWDFLTPHV